MKNNKSAGGLWLRLIKKLTRIFKCPGQSKNNAVSGSSCDYPCQPITNLQASLTRLENEVQIIKKQVQNLQSNQEAPKDGKDSKNGIENFTVERMYVDKFELNVESIDVETVSGALNVGIIHNSMVGAGQPGGMGAPGAGYGVKNNNLKQIINDQMDSTGEKKYIRTFYPNQDQSKIIIDNVN
ncbi:MAG: hypothetical protein FH756_04655 [Firmicutes bacterium]|nr:hypothetical protein [Bacillota bacterium]